MMKKHLHPCPYCGAKPHSLIVKSMAVMCTMCLASGPRAATANDATTAWNKRTGVQVTVRRRIDGTYVAHLRDQPNVATRGQTIQEAQARFLVKAVNEGLLSIEFRKAGG